MSYSISIQSSGKSFQCQSDQDLLKAGIAAGLLLPFSCRSGMCRTCRGQVLHGAVDHGGAHIKYLSESEREQGFALLCCARPLSDLAIKVEEIDPLRGIQPKKMPARVLGLNFLTADVAVVTLGLPANEPMLFQAGQFVDVFLANGLRRSYSIASTPTAEGVRQLELHIRHMPGGQFTDYVFKSMKVRDILKIEMPLGSFYLREDSQKHIVLLASGTGFAPIKAILGHCLNQSMTRPITVYWGGRRQSDLYMMDYVKQLAAEHQSIKFVPVLSDAIPQAEWAGRTGFVHEAVMQDFPDLSGQQVYACGVPVMVDAARQDFTAHCNLDPLDFFADSFTSEADKAKAFLPILP